MISIEIKLRVVCDECKKDAVPYLGCWREFDSVMLDVSKIDPIKIIEGYYELLSFEILQEAKYRNYFSVNVCYKCKNKETIA